MATPDCVISIEETSRPEDMATVNKGLDAYNLQFAPPDEYRPLNVFLRTSHPGVGSGVEFVNVTPEQEAALKQLVSKLQPPGA